MKQIIFAVIIMFTCCNFKSLANSMNLVANPGFETLGDYERPLDWRIFTRGRPYSISKESPHSGTYCLKYHNTDPYTYRVASTPVKLKPGCAYEISAWVRVKDLKGKGSGATIGLEWSNAAGKWTGGFYPKGITAATNKWVKLVAYSKLIPNNAAKVRFNCYVRKGMTGTVWFDDVTVREHKPQIFDHLVTDVYRNITDGGTVTVTAGTLLAARHETPEQVNFSLDVTDENGKIVQKNIPNKVKQDRTIFRINASKLKVGKYILLCKAESKRKTFTIKCPLKRVNRLPQRKAWIDKEKRLVLDRKLFFPLGIYYYGKFTPKIINLLADSPFNCVMPYAEVDIKTLDKAWDKKLRVIYNLKDYFAGKRGCKTEKDAQNKIIQLVAERIDHPSIIAWYINDEMNVSQIDVLKAHRDLLETLDPGRPTWTVIYQYRQTRGYLPSLDIIGTDPYPIPGTDISQATLYSKAAKDQTFNSRAIWMVPQIFNWASYRKGKRKECRAPSLAEMRNMAWQCIANGANGLVFYSLHDLFKMDKTVENGGAALVREPFEQRWQEVKQMATEIKRYLPVLLSKKASVHIKPTTSNKNIVTRIYDKSGENWLLAVNSSRKTVSQTFEISAPVTSMKMELGQEKAELSGKNALSLKFAPLEIKLLKLK